MPSPLSIILAVGDLPSKIVVLVSLPSVPVTLTVYEPLLLLITSNFGDLPSRTVVVEVVPSEFTIVTV